MMKAEETRELGQHIAVRLRSGEIERAYALLAPVLARRTRFPKLGLIGAAAGAEPSEEVDAFLDRVAAEKTEGGWVVIGKALGQRLHRDMAGAFKRCRAYIIAADVWYGADILAERVPGPALVTRFGPALTCLRLWRDEESAWVRRAVGVAVHFWAKRSRGLPELRRHAEAMLAFLAPMFEEWDMDAAKGIGWGLKTMGKYYPDLVADWLAEEIVPGGRRHRAVMLRKALTYLSEKQRARAGGRAL